MIFGIDYASKTPSAKILKQQGGVKFVCRYVSTESNPKNITVDEVKDLLGAGVDIVVVFETTANRALDGFKAGASDAHSARQQTAAVGLPNCAVYFAVDFDMSPAQEAAVKAYFQGVASVLGKKKSGVYGGYKAVSVVQGSGIVKYGWQTFAWSYGKWFPKAQLRQVKNAQLLCGVSCDYDNAVVRDFGQSPRGVKKVVKKVVTKLRNGYIFAKANGFWYVVHGGIVMRIGGAVWSKWKDHHKKAKGY